MIDRWCLDQSGCAPTRPTGSGWGRLGTRLVVPDAAPQGRRVHVVGALAPYGPTGPRFRSETRRTAAGRSDAAAHLAFVGRVAGVPADAPRARPCVFVLDNYSVHHAQEVKDAVPDLEAQGVSFCYLPPYSPDRNPIEPVWRQAKHQDLPERSHPTDRALQAAVAGALADRARKLAESAHDLPRSA